MSDTVHTDLEELNGPNIGFKFLWEPGRNESAATIKLQWCLAPQLAEYLRNKEVTNAQIFIVVRNPHNRETRLVAALESPQQFLEFHCSGTHEVSGTVVWGEMVKNSTTYFLQKNGRDSYHNDLETSVRRGNSQSLGRAELSVEVTDGFFAPEMSPTHAWYVNLWFGEPAWDECEIRRRKLIAYFVATPLLAVWVPFIFFARLTIAFWLSVICVRADVPWEAVVRPFDYDTNDLLKFSTKRWSEDLVLRILLVPQNHLIVFGIAFMVGALVGAGAQKIGLTAAVWGLSTMAAVYGATMLGVLIRYLVRLFVSDEMRARWMREREEREAKLRKEHLDSVYAELLCTTAPVSGVRKKRQGFKNTAVLVYHNAKARLCRPAALH